MDLAGVVGVGPGIGFCIQISIGMVSSANGYSARYIGPGKALEIVVGKGLGFVNRGPGVFTAGQGAFLVIPGQLVIL